MTLSVSAASAPAVTIQANASDHNQRNAVREVHVEFIYTPDNRRFSFSFNDLCKCVGVGATTGASQSVGDLDSPMSTPPRTRQRGPLQASAADGKTSHNGQCVTLEPRRRYNM